MVEVAVAKSKLRDNLLLLLPRMAVNDGQFEVIFSDGYQMIWRYIRDYTKALGKDPKKIRKGGRQDPIFFYLNEYMYPLGQSQPTAEETADRIIETAEDYINNIK